MEGDVNIFINNGEINAKSFFTFISPLLKKYIKYYLYYLGFSGSIESHNEITNNLSKRVNCIVASIEYRLVPENKFPDGFNDCYEVCEELLKNQSKYNVAQNKIIMMGDSAGGNLVAALCHQLRDNNLID